MALSVYEVVKGISQAIANKHHGATDENGKAVDIGLKRDDQPINDQQVMDGFGISMHGNTLVIRYHSVEPIQSLHQKKYEKQVEMRIDEIKRYITKEFDRLTGNSLRLKEMGDVKVLVETANRVKVIVKAQRAFEILNLKGRVDAVGSQSSREKLEQIADSNKQMMKKPAKPKNVTRKDKK
jgi:hypothetical protein